MVVEPHHSPCRIRSKTTADNGRVERVSCGSLYIRATSLPCLVYKYGTGTDPQHGAGFFLKINHRKAYSLEIFKMFVMAVQSTKSIALTCFSARTLLLQGESLVPRRIAAQVVRTDC